MVFFELVHESLDFKIKLFLVTLDAGGTHELLLGHLELRAKLPIFALVIFAEVFHPNADLGPVKLHWHFRSRISVP